MQFLLKNKHIFQTIYYLANSQPWLTKKFDELMQLLFEDCKSEEQRELVIDLVNRFVYVSNETYAFYVKQLGEEIATEPGISDCNTQLVAMAADSTTDSSQYVLYSLKAVMEEFGWRRHKTVNTFGRILKSVKASPSHKNIILVDEFIGSGQTVNGRVNTTTKTLTENGIADFSIKVKVLASTEEGLNKLKDNGIDVTSQLSIKKGLSDHFPPELLSTKIKLMLELESILHGNYNGAPLPSLGYSKTESLYCRDGGNTPNNVFPIFWWPLYKDGSSRRVILTRAMCDA